MHRARGLFSAWTFVQALPAGSPKPAPSNGTEGPFTPRHARRARTGRRKRAGRILDRYADARGNVVPTRAAPTESEDILGGLLICPSQVVRLLSSAPG